MIPNKPGQGYKESMSARPSKPDSDSARLFLALWPPPSTRAAVAMGRDGWPWPPGARPVSDERLHLTLHFIGAVPRLKLPELAHGLALPFRAFELVGGPAELWPHGVAVQGLQQPSVPLLALHAALGRAIEALGLPVEARRYAPHVTLARKASGARPPACLPAWHWRVRGYRLVESLPGGAGYRAIARFAAGQPA